MSAAKKKREDSGKCAACDVLGDYMCAACDVLGDYMCAGMPADRPGQAQDKMKDEPAKES